MANPIPAPAALLPLSSTPIQPLSIRRLSIARIEQTLSAADRQHLQTRPANERLAFLCRRIIGLVNKKLQDKGHKETTNDGEVELKGFFEPAGERQDAGNGFSLLFYSRQIMTISKLAQAVASLNINGTTEKMQACRVEMIGFLFRQHMYQNPDQTIETYDDLYTLTVSDAWRGVAQFTEFEFPQYVLMRLLESKVHSVVYQELVGNSLRTDKDFKEQEELQPTRYFDKFITQLTSRIRPQASVYRLKAFCNTGNKLPKKETQVKIEMGAIRFQKHLALGDYPPLLDHLSHIHHRKITYEVKVGDKQVILPENGPEEKDKEVLSFWKYLKPVEPAEKAALESLMDQTLWKAFQEGVPAPLFFCHRLVKDYARSSSFRLVSRLISNDKQNECTWDSPKSATEMLHLLRNVVPSLHSCQNANDFVAILKEIKIEFKVNEKTEKCALRKMFGGEIRITETQKSYFHVNGLWLSLSPEYLRWVHTEFRQLLADCLLKPGDPRVLQHQWPTDADIAQAKRQNQGLYAENVYNLSYYNTPNFLIGDRICIEKIELFDLLQIVPQGIAPEVVLYHVKGGFGQPTRAVASQIRVSATLLHESLSTSTPEALSRLDQVCTSLEKIYPNCLQKVGGRNAFLSSFTRKQITYVYAVYDDSKSGRLLANELMKKEFLTAEDLYKLEGHEPIAILQSLQRAGFLTQQGNLTSKFQSSTQEQFKETMSAELHCAKVRAQELYQHINHVAVSSFESLIARLELIKLRRQLEKKQIAFRICEIPQAGGFQYGAQPNAAAPPAVVHAQALVIPPQIFPLTAGQVFLYLGTQYQIQDTVRDGTCALYAVFGDRINGRYYYNGGREVARQSFANELLACVNNHMAHPRGQEVLNRYYQIVGDLLLGRTAQGTNGRAFGTKLGAKARQYRDSWTALQNTLHRAQQGLNTTFVTTFNKMKTKNARNFDQLMAIFGPGLPPAQLNQLAQQLATNPHQLEQAFNYHRAAIEHFFRQPNFPVTYNAPCGYFVQIQNTNAALQAIINQFCADPEVFQVYLACIRDGDYWFDTNDICLAGLLRGQGIRIFMQLPNGDIGIADQILETLPNCRQIFHQERHFMRCLP